MTAALIPAFIVVGLVVVGLMVYARKTGKY